MKQFLLYCLCGGTGVLTDLAIYWLAVHAGVHYQLANVAGYVSGTLVSFALNRVITFNQRDKVGQRLAMFLAVAAVGYAASAALLAVLIGGFGLDARLAKVLSLPMVVALQFTLNRRFSFKQ
ncbi:GtrA family protein [Massilia sp. TS11]|uniref:GtrA family protein n=1 Tax=Massilia sp. TS11 TaxID=2908003 RepID=UPI001EDB07D6|nr:GtrA family protein [Massilia sp. TS11]MCG2583616.1 GtrA family protein [Massilia sp. TS11]